MRRPAMALLALTLALLCASVAGLETRQCTGARVGEVRPTSAIVWTRLTAATKRSTTGACPGAPGRIWLRLAPHKNTSDIITTGSFSVNNTTDFTHKFNLTALKPATTYVYTVFTTGPKNETHLPIIGQFSTPPLSNVSAPVTFTIWTCQRWDYVDDRRYGNNIFPSMAKIAPNFTVNVGDLVYYDKDAPFATNASLARFHWQRMFSLSRPVSYFLRFPAIWMHDDHDVLDDDATPMSKPYGKLTWGQGLKIFKEQTPVSPTGPPYRTFFWGKGLQVWVLEGREFRSPNSMIDGPKKTLLGAAQKAWLKSTFAASNATFKIIVTPEPWLGPDKKKPEGDNLSATGPEGFGREGTEMRKWASLQKNLYLVTGDRHWQYHSVDPTTGLHEFSPGPANDGWAQAFGSVKFDPKMHKFIKEQGGFVGGRVVGQTLNLTIFDTKGRAAHSALFKAKP